MDPAEGGEVRGHLAVKCGALGLFHLQHLSYHVSEHLLRKEGVGCSDPSHPAYTTCLPYVTKGQV